RPLGDREPAALRARRDVGGGPLPGAQGGLGAGAGGPAQRGGLSARRRSSSQQGSSHPPLRRPSARGHPSPPYLISTTKQPCPFEVASVWPGRQGQAVNSLPASETPPSGNRRTPGHRDGSGERTAPARPLSGPRDNASGRPGRAG